MLLSIQMTDKGERHVDLIIKYVFQYINMLSISLPSEDYYQQLRLLTEQRFETKEREQAVNTAQQYASAIHRYKPEVRLHTMWSQCLKFNFTDDLSKSLPPHRRGV